MRLLLDTHALLWWLVDDPRLSEWGAATIADRRNEMLVSAVSYYEIAYKALRRKLQTDLSAIGAAVRDGGFELMAVSCDHAARAGALPWEHRDPWDRLLAAQAEIEACGLLSADAVFDTLDVGRCW